MTKKQIEEALLFGSCRANAPDEMTALLDFELIQNMVSYHRVHILQPMKTARGYRSKHARTMSQQFEAMIDHSLSERRELGLIKSEAA